MQQPTNWFRPPSNKCCLYCGRLFDDAVATQKEHLIGRQFVPRGSFNNGRSWNFIFKACAECNNRKSRLEGHVGGITQFLSPDVASNTAYAQRSLEKAQGEHHPWTKRPIAQSLHESNLSVKGRSIGMSVSFVGPPQLDRSQSFELALRHVQALFAFVTNADYTSSRLRLLAASEFWPLGVYSRSDWGNIQLRAVHERTRGWKTYFHIATASDFFRFILKCSDSLPVTWYWLLEWNRVARVVGALSAPDLVPSFMTDLPQFQGVSVPAHGGAVWRVRKEVVLRDDLDDFFDAESDPRIEQTSKV